MCIAWGALLVSVWMEGGELRLLLNFPAFILVVGGTIGAAMCSFKMREVRQFPEILKQAFDPVDYEIREVVDGLVRLAEKARRGGRLALENEARRIDDPFLRRGILLVADGAEPDLIRNLLTNEIHVSQIRRRVGQSIFMTLGGFAPTLGIIGTVLGLVHMLANLSDPVKMGPAIAGAFLATLYGVSIANLICIPIANKLRARGSEEHVAHEAMLEGLLSIQAGDNPRMVHERLSAFVAPLPRPAKRPATEVVVIQRAEKDANVAA